MQWKDHFGDEEKSAVTPYSLVVEATAQGLQKDPSASGAQIGRENLSLFQIFGEDEVSERGLIGQVREAMDEVDVDSVNMVAAACLHYGRMFTEDEINLTTLGNTTKNDDLNVEVGARISQRKRAPFGVVETGGLILGKKAGKGFGFTRLSQVECLHIDEDTVEDFLNAIDDAKDKLATMANDIAAENKDVVLNGDFWTQGSESVKNEDSGYYDTFMVPIEQSNAYETDEGETRYSAYITLCVYKPWVMLEDIYNGEVPGKGLVWAEFNIGRGPGASWFNGMNEVVENSVCSPASLKIPQKRGRKPSPETIAKREAEAAAEAEEAEVVDPDSIFGSDSETVEAEAA